MLKSPTIAGWLAEVERAFVDFADLLPLVIDNVRMYANRI